ncbi:S8 family peptidase [Motilibacter deserti]|uniref:S8 family peptidase n=1 Tax=Motilibacter deserti TaxID=2714956 RepID=A0ABX0GWL0_9ACTN|nr:S8 family peptidase [Motilibacter deserti]NHC14086.1 S8 family peptidase [Motilibacter deserti]
MVRRGVWGTVPALWALAAVAAGAALGAPAPGRSKTPDADVVRVVARAASVEEAARAVQRVGGTVDARLPLVDSVAATVPASSRARLAGAPGVVDVADDRPVRVLGGPAPAPAADSEPQNVEPHAAETRVDELGAEGVTGEGATVAIVDTGVADVPQLAGRLVPVRDERTGRVDSCYDLSGERSCDDGYGHGTFLAGLVTGDDGVAPGARVLSVKVAGRDGATDVSTVLAAIQWVVSFRAAYGIDVLNLSLGTDSTQSYRTDPLNYAVERAWEAGIVVVAAAGNLGPAAGTVTKPADDPFVLSVGAVDDLGTSDIADDVLPDFSSRGPTRDGFGKPDVVAPGARLRSLRAPGSTIDSAYPPSEDGPYRTGSGTSMAAAVVSGIAALLAQARPEWGPDEVKHALMATARPAMTDDGGASGAGIVDAYAAARQAPPGRANEGLERSTGVGSIALSRGSVQVRVVGLAGLLNGLLLNGLVTAQLLTWDPVGYTTGLWVAPTWLASPLGRVAFSDVTWPAGHNWSGHNWSGHNWSGSAWSSASSSERQGSARDYGATGPGSAWYGAWE